MKAARVFLLSIGVSLLCTSAALGCLIGDLVWRDADCDGIQDSGESGIANVRVILLQGDQEIMTTTTDAYGRYQFDVTVGGPYTVRVDSSTLPAGYAPAPCSQGNDRAIDNNCSPATVVLPTPPDKERDDLTIDFGYCPPGGCTGTIGDYVWIDADRDGIQDTGEPGMPGVRLRLTGSGVDRTIVTDGQGNYLFTGLCPGTYTVVVEESTLPPPPPDAPPGTTWTRSPCDQGTMREVDSNCQPATVTLAGTDLTIDFGYYLRSGEEICTEDPDDPSRTIPLGTLTATVDQAGNVTVVFEESTNINDNSYGTNTVDWPRNHNFSDLVGSDKAEFRFTDTTGKVVFNFNLDYISAKTGTPSGYASLGVSGGEGRVLVGQASWLLSWRTSLADNLNNWGYCTNGNCSAGGVNLLLNSPPTSPADTYNAPQYPNWEFPIVYQVTVSSAAFGAAGFGGVTIPLVHNSPPKIGSNAASQVPCEPGPPSADCGKCKGGGVQLTLVNDGPAKTKVAVYEGTKAEKSKLLTGPSDLGPRGLLSFVGKGSDQKMGSEISIYVNGAIYAIIHTSCSQPIGPGLVRGDFKVLDGRSKDGGKLCPVPDCGECKGGVVQLTLKNNGDTKNNVAVYEGTKAEKSKLLLGPQTIAKNEEFTFFGKGSDWKMGSEISIYVEGVFYTKIHTSCSQPIGPGLVSRDFEVVEGYSKDGGKLCPLP